MSKISAVCSVDSWVAAQVMLQTGWPLPVEQLPWEALCAKTDRLPHERTCPRDSEEAPGRPQSRRSLD